VAAISRPDAVVRILGAPSPPHAAYERGVWEEATQLGLGDPRDFDVTDPGQRVPELIHAFDVLALTSVPRSEGMPTVILEAMAAGLPIVVTEVGGSLKGAMFWWMALRGGRFTPNAEADRLRWVTPKAAIKLLSSARDRGAVELVAAG